MATKTTDLSKQKKAVIQTFDGSDDIVTGTNYNDTFNGGGGNDRIAGGNGDDTIHGNDGNDIIWGDSANNAVANDNGQDSLYGDAGNDELHGGNGKDYLNGGTDDDKLYGDNGTDTLDGGAGVDTLYGGNGGDVLIGGGQADTFVYLTKTNSSVDDSPYVAGDPGTAGAPQSPNAFQAWSKPWDIITDFASGTDKIDLAQLPLTGGDNLVTDLIWRGAQGSDADAGTARSNFDHSVWTDDAGQFLYADINGDGKADLKIQVSGVGLNDLIGVEANDAPVFSSGDTGSVEENSPPTTVVYDADATDQEGDAITYSLVSGGDNDLFSIDADGKVTFIGSPDFENPLDANGDNAYEITVIASDGFVSTQQNVTISVTDVNEAPDAGDDFAVNVAEDVDDATVLATVSATDPDVGGGNDATSNFEDLTYSITGGNDAGLFEIDAATGEISLASGQSLDFETDPQHVLTVTVTDGGLMTDTVDVTINVTDVDEGGGGGGPEEDPSGPTGISLSLADAQAGNNLNNLGKLTGTGDTPGDTYIWSIEPGADSHIEIAADGTLSAVGIDPGTYTFTATATDPDATSNPSTSITFTLLVGHTGGALADDTMPNGTTYILSATGNNIELGEGGDDFLTGSAGVDYILGSGNDDIIKGLGGADTLSGGTGGKDKFVYTAVSDSATGSGDKIYQFDKGLVGAHDTLDFALLGINAGNVTVTDNGTDTTVTVDTGMEITLVGVVATEAELDIKYT